MSTRFRRSTPAFLHVATLVLVASPSQAASWVSINGYQPKANVSATVYVPDKVDASPGIVVSIHYCGGSATSGQGWFKGLADQYGFIIIAPHSPGNCFDAAPGRSGERADIAAMVDAVVKNNNADPARVFAAGASSGACMTNALLASYPDVFAGGSVLAGVPAGFWTGGGNCSVCSQNPPQKSAQEWGDIVRNASAGNGPPWPRVQLWHGTADTTLNYPNLAEEVKQWTNVLGLDSSSGTQENNTPSSGWTRTSYEDGSGTVVLQVNILQGGPHDLTSVNPQLWPEVVNFFGLDQDAAPGTGGAGNSGGSGNTGGGDTGGAGGAGGTSDGGTSSGGATSSGGGAGGGTSTSGGRTGIGGRTSSGGVAGSGGATSLGGRGDGGRTAAGGTSGAGGTTSAGGTSGAGGTTGVGGASGDATGGAITGGASATSLGGTPVGAGGSGTASGAVAATGATTGTGASSAEASGGDGAPTGTSTSESGGCSCEIAGGANYRGRLAVLVGAALTAVFRRRRRARSWPVARFD